MHLPGVRAQYEEVARQASAETWSYPEYLLELLERECQQRRGRRIERLLKESRLPLEKSWVALELKCLPAKAVQQFVLRAKAREFGRLIREGAFDYPEPMVAEDGSNPVPPLHGPR